jgi:hypothetical protein
LTGIVVRNTLVTYDRHNEKIGFWKTNCSELWERLHIGGAPSPGPSGDPSSQADFSPAPAPSGLPGLCISFTCLCLHIFIGLFCMYYSMNDKGVLIIFDS